MVMENWFRIVECSWCLRLMVCERSEGVEGRRCVDFCWRHDAAASTKELEQLLSS